MADDTQARAQCETCRKIRENFHPQAQCRNCIAGWSPPERWAEAKGARGDE